MRRAARLLALLGLLAGPVAAQESRTLTHYLPFVTMGPNTFPVLGGFYHAQRRAPYDSRVSSAVGLRVSAGAGFDGTRFARAEFDAPLLAPGWRLRVLGEGYRASRAGFYGLGPDTEEPAEADAAPYPDRVRRMRWTGSAELTRHVGGPFSVALAGAVVHSAYEGLPGPTIYDATVGGPLDDTDASVRGTLVLDTRTIEYDTPAGILAEAGYLVGNGGDGYGRWHAIVRGYLPVADQITLVARVLASDLDGDPSLDPRSRLAAWEDEVDLLGGPDSHRALAWNRYMGTGVLAGSAEARWAVLDKGDFGALTLLAFVDAGRVFEGESFAFTASDMAVGAGGGVAARVWRSNVATLTVAGGPDGVAVLLGGGWMF